MDFEFDNAFSQIHFKICDIDSVSDFQAVSVKGKVMEKGEQDSVNVRGQTLTEWTCIIAEETKSIQLTVWEGKVYLEVGKSYLIEGLSVRTLMIKSINNDHLHYC